MNHKINEIKSNGQRQARWLRRLNNALEQATNDPDEAWRNVQAANYRSLLEIVHVNGANGSLLVTNEVAR